MIGHSVVPVALTLTHAPTHGGSRVSASSDRTRPPATISSPIKTGARNCAEILVTRRRIAPAHATTHGAMWPIVNMPWAMMPSNPTDRANVVVLVQRVLVAAASA